MIIKVFASISAILSTIFLFGVVGALSYFKPPYWQLVVVLLMGIVMMLGIWL